MDFVSDQLSNGRRFRVLNVVGDYSRECIGQLADITLSGERVVCYLTVLSEQRGKQPKMPLWKVLLANLDKLV